MLFRSPNPSSGNVKISFSEILNLDTKIEIIDLLGKKYEVSSYFQNSSNEIEIDLKHLTKGSYVIKIYSDNEIITKKIVLL